MLGEFLFNLTPRDEQSPGLEIVHRLITAVDPASTRLITNYTVPQGKILNLRRLGFIAVPGAARIFEGFHVAFMERQDSNIDHRLWFPGVNSATAFGDGILLPAYTSATGPVGKQENFDIYLEENTILRGICDFDLANAANTLAFIVWGILIPRGNVVV